MRTGEKVEWVLDMINSCCRWTMFRHARVDPALRCSTDRILSFPFRGEQIFWQTNQSIYDVTHFRSWSRYMMRKHVCLMIVSARFFGIETLLRSRNFWQGFFSLLFFFSFLPFFCFFFSENNNTVNKKYSRTLLLRVTYDRSRNNF